MKKNRSIVSVKKRESEKIFTDAPLIKQVRSTLIHHVLLFGKRHYRQPSASIAVFHDPVQQSCSYDA